MSFAAGTVGWPAPPGVTPNFVDPESFAPRWIIVASVVLFLSTVFLALRLWTRAVLLRRVGYEDYFAVGAWVCAVISTSLSLSLLRYGFGRHTWDVPMAWTMVVLERTPISVSFYLLCLMLVKLSIVLMFMRIGPNPKFRKFLWVIFATIVASTVGLLLGNFLGCLSKDGKYSLAAHRQCDSNSKFTIATSVVNISTDLVCLLLPIPILRQVALPLKQKIALGFVLTTGSFVIIVSIMRLYNSRLSINSKDPALDGLNCLIWSTVEMHIAVCCACMPVLKPWGGVIARFAHRCWSAKGGGPSAMMVAGINTEGNIRMRDVNIKSNNKTRQSKSTHRELHLPSRASQQSLTVTESEDDIQARPDIRAMEEGRLGETYDKKIMDV